MAVKKKQTRREHGPAAPDNPTEFRDRGDQPP
jgi:hypothetical protein